MIVVCENTLITVDYESNCRVLRGRVARMADQLSVSQPTPCELRALSGGLQALDLPEFSSLSHILDRKSLASSSAAVV